MEQPIVLCDEEQGPSQAHDDDAELIFVGVERAKEDAELIFVGMSSNSKPAQNSNILNRVTPGSRLKRKRNHLGNTATQRLQPSNPVAPATENRIVLPASPAQSPANLTSQNVIILPESPAQSPAASTADTVIVLPTSPASPAESRSTDSPIIIEPLSEPDYGSNSPQVVPGSSSKGSPLVTISNSKQSVVKSALTVDLNGASYVLKPHSTSEVNVINPKRPEPIIEIIEEPLSTFHTSSPQQSTVFNNVPKSLNPVTNGAPLPEDSVHIRPINMRPHQENGLTEVNFSRPASQETFDPKKGTLTLLLSDFYYGQHRGDGQPEQKTHTSFKCPSCSKALKNVKFMNHTKHHLELERQGNDGWESHTTCQHCHRQLPSPFQLECHVDRVHTAPDPTLVCRICELSFETHQVLLQHMKDNHKPGEMPYECHICKYRSSAFAEVETHFRKCHVNTKNLLCPFCLKIFKTGTPYMCHYRGHWERNGHQCSRCRLQFLTFKEKMEHKTRYHQMFKKPKQLEGLPPDTKVIIQVSLEPVQSESEKVASITVSTTDWEPSSPGSQGRPSKKSQ